MNIADRYTQYVRDRVYEGCGWKSAFLGFKLFSIKNHIAPDKSAAKGYRELETIVMDYMCHSLSSRFAFSSIFTPHEILMASGINAISTEAISCFLSHGYSLEKFLIDESEREGIATTLCSYHKAFIAFYIFFGGASADIFYYHNRVHRTAKIHLVAFQFFSHILCFFKLTAKDFSK